MIWLEALLAGGGVLAADQATKALAIARRTAPAAERGPRFFFFQPLLNRRGILPASAWRTLLVLWVFCVALAVLMLSSDAVGHSSLGAAGVGMTVGGVTGNLVDRLRCGAVIDFIAIGPWPVFNLADAAIVSGLAMAFLSIG